MVNNPDSGGNGMGFVFGMILLVVSLFLFIVYGVPALRSSMGGQNVPRQININPPQSQGGGGINLSEELDINVNQTK